MRSAPPYRTEAGWHGPQYRGAARDQREQKRREADHRSRPGHQHHGQQRCLTCGKKRPQ